MKKIYRTVKNIGALLAAEILGKVLFFALFIVLSYKFTPADLGGYITLIAFLCLTTALSDLGISQILVREIAKDRSSTGPLLSHGLTIISGTTILACLILAIIGKFGGYPTKLRPLIALTGLAVIGNCFMQLGFSVFRGYERMEIQASITSFLLLISSLVGMGLAIANFTLTAQLINIVTWSIAGAVITLGIIHRRFVKVSFAFDGQTRRQLFFKALPIALLIWCGIFLQWFHLLALGLFRPMSDVAIYGTACKIFDGAGMLIGCGIIALVPVMSIYWTESVDRARLFYENSLRTFAAVGLGGTTGLVLLADSIIPAIFGVTYLEAIAPFRILAFSFFLIALSAPVVVLLLSVDGLLQRFLPLLALVLLGNVLLNLALASRFGYIGSASAFLLTALIIFMISKKISRTCFGRIRPVRATILRPTCASIVMALALWKLRTASIFLSIPVGFVVFIIALGLLGEFQKEPYKSLWMRKADEDA